MSESRMYIRGDETKFVILKLYFYYLLKCYCSDISQTKWCIGSISSKGATRLSVVDMSIARDRENWTISINHI